MCDYIIRKLIKMFYGLKDNKGVPLDEKLNKKNSSNFQTKFNKVNNFYILHNNLIVQMLIMFIKRNKNFI